MLDYIEYPPGETVSFRNAIQGERAKIVKVTNRRIYFEEK